MKSFRLWIKLFNGVHVGRILDRYPTENVDLEEIRLNFDSLFEFDRQLKETMAYANTKKNGSLHERLQMDTLELEIPPALDGVLQEEIVNDQATDFEKPNNDLSEQIHISITDDVDDEAVYGKNRHRLKHRGR